MKSNLCTECDGKGFYWKAGHILDKRNDEVIATTYTQGPKCLNCKGTGLRSEAGWLTTGWLIVLIAFIIFGLIPLFRLIF